MRRNSKFRPSPSMIVAVIALFVSLGGVGYAAAVIGSAQIKNNSVRTEDIHNSTITGKDVKNGSLFRKDVKKNAFEPAKQWILIASDGKTKLAGSPGVTIDQNSAGNFTYVDFGRSVANRAIVATSAKAANAAGNNDATVTPCGGSVAAPGGSQCFPPSLDDVNHVLLRKNTFPQPYYLVVF
jgi:hypothetical protein